MIREMRLTTRSGSWFSPIPQHAASEDLITYPRSLVLTSSHLYGRLCARRTRGYTDACCLCMGYFSLTRQRVQTMWACVYTRCTDTRGPYIAGVAHVRAQGRNRTPIGRVLFVAIRTNYLWNLRHWFTTYFARGEGVIDLYISGWPFFGGTLEVRFFTRWMSMVTGDT